VRTCHFLASNFVKILTDFQNSFTVGNSKQCLIKIMQRVSSYVAELPWETLEIYFHAVL